MQLIERQLPMTAEGRDELALEVACLEETRKHILEELAQLQGGSEAGLRSELSSMDAEIECLRMAINYGQLVENSGLTVAIGSAVVVNDGTAPLTITISGPLAANPHHNFISYESPMARALLGRELGEVVELKSPGGLKTMKITGIAPGSPGAGRR